MESKKKPGHKNKTNNDIEQDAEPYSNDRAVSKSCEELRNEITDEELLRYLQLLEARLKEDVIHILIINPEADRDKAFELKTGLKENVKITISNIERPVNVKLLEEIPFIHDKGEHLDFAYERSILIFLYITKAFFDEKITYSKGSACWEESLDDPDLRSVYIINTAPESNRNYRLPRLLRSSMRAIDYWPGTESKCYRSTEGLIEYYNASILKKERNLHDERKKYIKDNYNSLRRSFNFHFHRAKSAQSVPSIDSTETDPEAGPFHETQLKKVEYSPHDTSAKSDRPQQQVCPDSLPSDPGTLNNVLSRSHEMMPSNSNDSGLGTLQPSLPITADLGRIPSREHHAGNKPSQIHASDSKKSSIKTLSFQTEMTKAFSMPDIARHVHKIGEGLHKASTAEAGGRCGESMFDVDIDGHGGKAAKVLSGIGTPEPCNKAEKESLCIFNTEPSSKVGDSLSNVNTAGPGSKIWHDSPKAGTVKPSKKNCHSLPNVSSADSDRTTWHSLSIEEPGCRKSWHGRPITGTEEIDSKTAHRLANVDTVGPGSRVCERLSTVGSAGRGSKAAKLSPNFGTAGPDSKACERLLHVGTAEPGAKGAEVLPNVATVGPRSKITKVLPNIEGFGIKAAEVLPNVDTAGSGSKVAQVLPNVDTTGPGSKVCEQLPLVGSAGLGSKAAEVLPNVGTAGPGSKVAQVLTDVGTAGPGCRAAEVSPNVGTAGSGSKVSEVLPNTGTAGPGSKVCERLSNTGTAGPDSKTANAGTAESKVSERLSNVGTAGSNSKAADVLPNVGTARLGTVFKDGDGATTIDYEDCNSESCDDLSTGGSVKFDRKSDVECHVTKAKNVFVNCTVNRYTSSTNSSQNNASENDDDDGDGEDDNAPTEGDNKDNRSILSVIRYQLSRLCCRCCHSDSLND